MKLHLPKLLFVAIMATFCSVAYATDTVLKKGESSTYTATTTDVTLSGDDRVGHIDANGALYTAFKATAEGRTQSYTVNGNLTISGNAQVAVGGGPDNSTVSGLRNNNDYAILSVSNGTVTVNDNGYLTATRTNIKDLVINSGKVELHTNGGEGGIDSFGDGNNSYTANGKMAIVTNSVTINGGTLTCGVKNGAYVVKKGNNGYYTTNHATTGFKGSINQTGGTMSVRGDSALSGAFTINQTGSNTSAMYFTDNLELGSSLTVNQSNDNATLVIGRLTAAYGTKTANINQTGNGSIQLAQGSYFGGNSTINVTQSGGGKIDIGGKISTATAKAAGRDTSYDNNRPNTFTANKTTYNISQTGNGATLTLKSGATIQANQVDIAGTFIVQGALTTKELTLTSGAKLDNNGTLTVGTGSAGTAGELKVTTGGTLGVVLDGTNAAINVGAAAADTSTVTGWKMEAGSKLEIGFTGDVLGTAKVSDNDDTKSYELDVLVAKVADGSSVTPDDFGCTYQLGDIAETDAIHWTGSDIGLATKSATGADIYLTITLTYNPWIDIQNGGTNNESYGDASAEKELYTGLAISEKDVVLKGDNTHSFGTRIDGGTAGIKVTLGHENALGTGEHVKEGRAAVETSGTTTLKVSSGITANLPGTIGNSGALTMQGSFNADNIEAYAGTVGELYLDADNKEGTDGFKRTGDGSGNYYQIVENSQGATLTVADGTTVQKGTDQLQLFTDGIAGKVDYGTYYMISGADASSGDILDASGVDTVVDMAETAGTLTADESIAVNSKGGTVKLQEGDAGPVTVSGSLADTTVESAGGMISADITGTSSVAVTGDTTLSGDNTYTGTTTVTDAELTLESDNALGGSSQVKTEGASSLVAAEGVTAKLSGTIVNAGNLTLQGDFSASSTVLGGEKEVQDSYFALDGTVATTADGFRRAGGTGYLVVENLDGATLNLQDVTLQVDSTDYILYENGYAGMNTTDYGTYHMNDENSAISVSQITTASQELSENQTKADTIVMSKGTLTADESIEVNSTDGTVKLQEGAAGPVTVSGSLADTTVESAGGTISADITGTSSVAVTGDTTLSGDNTYTGTTTVTDAELTLESDNALGDSSQVKTEGASSLVAAEGVTAKLSGTIANTGNLTLQGDFNADKISVYTGQFDDVYINTDAEEGPDGFKREGNIYQIVENSQGATLTVADGTTVQKGAEQLQLFTDGIAGKVDYGTYYMISGADASSGAILDASGVDTVVDMAETAGTLTADESIEVNSKGGTVKLQEGAAGPVTVSGSLADTTVESAGGTISADITGTSSVAVTGDTTLSGTNSYSGDTIIDGVELKLELGSSVGTGAVELKNHGTFDMGGNALSNFIKVTGCTLRGAGSYAGDMEVHDELELADATTANKVTLVGAGSLTGSDLTVNELDVQTDGDASVGGSLTINDNGTVTLNNGKVLNVGGSLTLDGATTLALNGDYAVGTKLLSSTGTLTMGDVTLEYADTTVELEQQGNSLVLVSKFKQDKAAAAVQGNWGIATASRAFVNAVRGQRTNTGCIANGRGTAWAAVLGAFHDLAGSDINVKGAAMGVDWKLSGRHTLGAAIGYTDGEVSPKGLSKLDQEGTYLAVYGEHGLKKLSDTTCLSLDWVLAYGQTESDWNGMSWNQDSLQLNARVNWNKKLSERLGMSVFGGLEYFTSDSATVGNMNTGDIRNLRAELGVGARYVACGAPEDKKMGPTCQRLVLHGELRYMNDLMRSNPEVTMAGLRGEGENPGRSGVGLEAGATYRINDRWSTSANYSFNALQDSREHRVNVGASYSF